MNEKKLQLDVEYMARDILEGSVPHEQWMFAFGDWTAEDSKRDLLSSVLHRWNTHTTIPSDEPYFEVIVYDAMDAACIFLSEKPLSIAFAWLPNVSSWVKDFSGSMLKVNV